MPDLIRLYIRHALIGFGISAVFVAGLLYLNVANLWHLVSTSNLGWIAVLMLFMFNGIVFAGAQFGIQIMRMAEDNKPAGGSKRRIGAMMKPALVPVTQPAKTDDDKLQNFDGFK